MIVVRKYDVEIAESILDEVRKNDWPQGALIDICTRLCDAGDCDELVLVRWKEAFPEYSIEAGTLEWMSARDHYDPDYHKYELVYTIEDWGCVEISQTVE